MINLFALYCKYARKLHQVGNFKNYVPLNLRQPVVHLDED